MSPWVLISEILNCYTPKTTWQPAQYPGWCFGAFGRHCTDEFWLHFFSRGPQNQWEREGKESLDHSRLKKKTSPAVVWRGESAGEPKEGCYWKPWKFRRLGTFIQSQPAPAGVRHEAFNPSQQGWRTRPRISTGQFKYPPFFSFLLSFKLRLISPPQWRRDITLNNNFFFPLFIFFFEQIFSH